MRFELDRARSIRVPGRIEMVSFNPLGMVKLRVGSQATSPSSKRSADTFSSWNSKLIPLASRGLVRPIYADTSDDAKEMVSIVVPTKDHCKELEACLGSIRKFHPANELIVVDDGSRNAALVEAISAKYRAIHIRITQGNGPASARNLGLARSTHEHVLFVDSDVKLVPSTLSRLLCWTQIPEVLIVGPRIVAGGNGSDPGLLQRAFHTRFPLDMGRVSFSVGDLDPNQRKTSKYFPSAVLLVRRSAVLELGGFDEGLRYGEDVDLLWRVAEAKGLAVYDPQAWAYHLIDQKPIKQIVKNFQYGRSNSQLAKRHPERMSAFSVSDPVSLAIGLMPLLSPGGLLAALLSPSFRFIAHPNKEFSNIARRKASLAIASQVALGMENLYSKTYLAPVIVLSLGHKGVRRTLLWLFALRIVKLALSENTSSILLFDLGASLTNALAYSLGAWEKAIADRRFTYLRIRLAS